MYHSAVEGRWEDQEAWRRIDYLWAIAYFLVSLAVWWFVVCAEGGWGMWESMAWCVVSLVVFGLDWVSEEHGGAHMLWHALTGVGVGRMIASTLHDRSG